MEDQRRVDREAVQLTLYVAAPYLHDRRCKVDELLRRAAAMGASGATVLAAYQGFGRRHSHEPMLWQKVDETPLTVISVDTADRIERLQKVVDEVLPDVVAVTEQMGEMRYLRHHTR